MRSLFISDLHASLRLPHARLSETATTSDRLQDVGHVLDRVIAYAAEHDVTQVFVLGDLFHQRHPDAPTLHAVAQRLRALSRVVERVLLLPGNHDAHDKAGRIYSLSFFDALQVPGIEVLLDRSPLRSGDLTFWPMPWVPRELTEGWIAETTQRLEGETTHVLLMHHTVRGCLDGHRRVQQGLASSSLRGFDLVLSGHIHRPQRLGACVYLGSPLELRASENDGESRGFWVMDDDPSTIRQIVIEDSPRFLRWDLDAADLAAGDLDALDARLEAEAGALARTLARRPVYLDVHLRGPGASIAAMEGRVRAHLEALEAASGLRQVRVQRQIDDLGAGRRLRGAVQAGTIATPDGLLRAWLELGAPEPGEDREGLLRLGLALLEDHQPEDLEALLTEADDARC